MFPSLALIPNSLPLTFPSPGKQRVSTIQGKQVITFSSRFDTVTLTLALDSPPFLIQSNSKPVLSASKSFGPLLPCIRQSALSEILRETSPGHEGSAQKVVSQRRPTLASSQLSRPKGTVFSVDNLPQEIKNLQPSQRNGVVFNLDDLSARAHRATVASSSSSSTRAQFVPRKAPKSIAFTPSNILSLNSLSKHSYLNVHRINRSSKTNETQEEL
ncbi:hypothetical protein PSHT_15542 [Puccinia striiformis]|uniref:Uncharacterized protein n=1 Tax=Puccinia striiformis TaxID=27350 RepID=A0A2S4UEJ1_9BASI|nr:hypothetical protein PSHT_15542 [Puccinia striiformis]